MMVTYIVFKCTSVIQKYARLKKAVKTNFNDHSEQIEITCDEPIFVMV